MLELGLTFQKDRDSQPLALVMALAHTLPPSPMGVTPQPAGGVVPRFRARGRVRVRVSRGYSEVPIETFPELYKRGTPNIYILSRIETWGLVESKLGGSKFRFWPKQVSIETSKYLLVLSSRRTKT